jgi:hypothetical protein
LHVHTRFSADAYIYGTRAEPHDAYAFAKGAAIAISDTNERRTRTAHRSPARLRRRHRAFRVSASRCCGNAWVRPYDFDICMFRSAETPQTQFDDHRLALRGRDSTPRPSATGPVSIATGPR